jgi:hypothetical protein
VTSTALSLLTLAAPAGAHHSFSAVFDRDSSITVTGFRARERPRTGAVRSITLASGEQLFGAQDESR